MRKRTYSECLTGNDPLDYIAYSIQVLEEKDPIRYQQMYGRRLKLTLEPRKEGDHYWSIAGDGLIVVQGRTQIDETKLDTLPIRIHNFLKNCGFMVEENSGIIN